MMPAQGLRALLLFGGAEYIVAHDRTDLVRRVGTHSICIGNTAAELLRPLLVVVLY